MRRADRLFEIIQILRRERGPISAEAIGVELEVSKRSVYRDIAVLIAQRVPIRGEAGIGYVLDRGFDMPPLMLTSEEIEAAVLGAMWVSTRGEPELAKAAENLMAKIEAITPDRLRPHIFDPAVSVRPALGGHLDVVSSSLLRQTIRAGKKLALVYRDKEGTQSSRVVWPVLLGYRDEGRILAAWCELRAGFRYFRTDRMISANALDERYPERPAQLRTRLNAAMIKERARYEGRGDADKP